MALFCICGVCVPYSALVPLLLLAIKWVVEKLVCAGLLPEWIEDKLARAIAQAPRGAKKSVQSSAATVSTCCSSASAAAPQSSGLVKEIQSHEEWERLVSSSGEDATVIVKWTASWCQPCKAIQPLYESLAAKYPATTFFTADADNLDDIASKFSVAMLPTFIVYKGEKAVERYTGSNEDKLKSFIDQNMRATS